MAQRGRKKAGPEKIIGGRGRGPVLCEGVSAYGGDYDAFKGREGKLQPAPNPAFQCHGPRDGARLDCGFQPPGMAVAADGQGGVTELEEGEIHLGGKRPSSTSAWRRMTR